MEKYFNIAIILFLILAVIFLVIICYLQKRQIKKQISVIENKEIKNEKLLEKIGELEKNEVAQNGKIIELEETKKAMRKKMLYYALDPDHIDEYRK